MKTNVKLLLFLLSLASCASPTAQFMVQGDLKAPASLQFENQSSNADSYQWTFGEEGRSEEADPSFEFPRAGNYLVSLEAKKGKKSSVAYQRVEIEGPEDCMVLIETNYGDMVVKLHNATPLHQANFLKLAGEGFYDDLLFHRVINGFMVQGGDPNSRNASENQRLGTGGPGYTIPAEFVDSLVHVKGALAAARTPDQVNPQKASSGSQFYLVHGRKTNVSELEAVAARGNYTYSPKQEELYLELGGTPFLDRNYTIFGQVIEGLEVIDKIASVRTRPGDRPREEVKMKISIIDYFPEKIKP